MLWHHLSRRSADMRADAFVLARRAAMIAATSRGLHTSQGRVRHMQAYICTACGMQYPPSASSPPDCPVCQEERQFVPLVKG